MSDFKTRLIEEQSQLDEKLNKLNNFNLSSIAEELSEEMQGLMIIQAGAMYKYNEVLKARIKLLE